MECEPVDRDVVVNVAWPETRFGVNSVVVPSLKETVPVGVPAPGATVLTVAVNVTDWPNTVGLPEETRAVVVSAMLTTWLSAGEVLELKLPLLPSPA